MKRTVTVMCAILCIIATLCICSGCAMSGATLLAAPASAETLSYDERQSKELESLSAAANAFAAEFSCAAYARYGSENMAVAPVSVYTTMALAAQCASGDTRSELLAALGVTQERLQSDFSLLYRSLTAEYKDDFGKISCKSELSDSIWIDDSANVKQSCLDMLAEKFFCYPYQADFDGDNRGANRAVREFVKERTRKLIDKDFDMGTDTLFAIVNVLYLKDVWNEYGKDLGFAEGRYSFTEGDGTVESVPLLSGYYNRGRAIETDTYRSFFTVTQHGYTLHFIVPKDNRTVADVFTADNVACLFDADYAADDEENRIHYNTRCIFPEFEAKFDKDVKDILKEDFGVRSLFDVNGCNFSDLTDDKVFCAEVRHVTDLTVDRKGIEGAAVTVMPLCGEAGPDGWENKYEDFVVDRSFAFVLTDSFGTVLFCGAVTSL